MPKPPQALRSRRRDGHLAYAGSVDAYLAKAHRNADGLEEFIGCLYRPFRDLEIIKRSIDSEHVHSVFDKAANGLFAEDMLNIVKSAILVLDPKCKPETHLLQEGSRPLRRHRLLFPLMARRNSLLILPIGNGIIDLSNRE